MVMESSTFVWHPGPLTNLNATLVLPVAQEQAVATNLQKIHNGEANDLLVEPAETVENLKKPNKSEGLSMYSSQRIYKAIFIYLFESVALRNFQCWVSCF